MRFHHPLVLLLGGVLSASSVGCSAVTAVVSDTRPAARQGRGAADKYAAIARVYENQGRYDQAEAMYRRSLKQNPGNTEVRASLQHLADRKAGRKFGNEITAEAIAKANGAENAVSETAVALNAKAPLAASLHDAAPESRLKAAEESSLKTASLTVVASPAETDSQTGTLSPASFEESTATAEITTAVPPEPAIFESAAAEATPGTDDIPEEEVASESTPAVPLVSAEQILAVVDAPGEHAELLLNGLKHGDSLETQCLAATLLGDCDQSHVAIREALQKANEAATDVYLRLAICDSRIQRSEHDSTTANCLIGLLEETHTDIQVQVCSSLHHFVGSESESNCVKALELALANDSAELRASAAVALGDFPNLPESVTEQLEKMINSDEVTAVREAARSANERALGQSGAEIPEIEVMPRK